MIWFLLACDDEIFPTPSGGESVSGDSIEDVKKVIEGDCLSCHSASVALGGLDLETDFCATVVDVASPGYGAPLVKPGDHAGSVLWNKLEDTGTYGGVMPQSGKVAQESIDTVAAWIDAGASCGEEDTGQDSGENPEDSGPLLEYTFQSVQENVFDVSCIACHVEGGQAPYLKLDAENSYGEIVNVPSSEPSNFDLVEPGQPANSYLMRKMLGVGISGDPMPPNGNIDPAQIAIVFGWISEGAPQ